MGITRAFILHASQHNRTALVGLALLAVMSASTATAQVQTGGCGPLENAYGPFDYRPDMHKAAPGDSEPHRVKRHLVESAHFNMEVEMLRRGITSHEPGGDLDYTLRAFPNHHRALASLLRGLETRNLDQIPRARYSSECYFMRAIAFRPDDGIVRMLFASFLQKKGRRDDALRQLGIAANSASDNPFTHYNLGLHYLTVGAYDKARHHAQEAMNLGFPRTELRDKLVAAGRWQEAAPTTAVGPTPSASGPAP